MTSIRTPYERALANGEGQKILAKGVAEINKRKEYSKKDTYQAAKEAASYLSHLSRGRVTIINTEVETISNPCSVCVNNKYHGGFEDICDACVEYKSFKQKENK